MSGTNTAGVVQEVLEATLEVPVLSRSQRQGDVGVFLDATKHPRGKRIGAEGVEVIRGESNRNAHKIVVEGDAWFAPSSDPGVLGFLEVGEGATAWLDHIEHHNLGFGTGHYVVKRQREAAPSQGKVQYVAD